MNLRKPEQKLSMMMVVQTGFVQPAHMSQIELQVAGPEAKQMCLSGQILIVARSSDSPIMLEVCLGKPLAGFMMLLILQEADARSAHEAKRLRHLSRQTSLYSNSKFGALAPMSAQVRKNTNRYQGGGGCNHHWSGQRRKLSRGSRARD